MNNTSPNQDIVLVGINSTYHHASFGLRYLKANLIDLEPRCEILEFALQKKVSEIADEVLQRSPKILGLSVYIWNAIKMLELVRELRAKHFTGLLVLGGPEVSYETQQQDICHLADHVFIGESDFLFPEFCQKVLLQNEQPTQKIVRGSIPDISQIQLPYRLYTEEDISHRIISVEASRGCPYKCEYCLSSLDLSVRNFPLDPFLNELELLIQRGARKFKFIDRTFNLNIRISKKILDFFLKHKDRGLFLHFEMVPDRLPHELKELIVLFPPGSLQFEIGIQTVNPEVANLISRKNDLPLVRQNLEFLAEQTSVHTHVDLIAGLPGEDLRSFAQGFDQVTSWAPHEVQVGILKRLRGTPIARHTEAWKMKYQEHAPYQVLQTSLLEPQILLQMTHFSRFWDLISNSGRFSKTCSQIVTALQLQSRSLFDFYWDLTSFFLNRFQRSHGISLDDLTQTFADYLKSSSLVLAGEVDLLLNEDRMRSQKSKSSPSALPPRQKRHQSSSVHKT